MQHCNSSNNNNNKRQQAPSKMHGGKKSLAILWRRHEVKMAGNSTTTHPILQTPNPKNPKSRKDQRSTSPSTVHRPPSTVKRPSVLALATTPFIYLRALTRPACIALDSHRFHGISSDRGRTKATDHQLCASI